jgi:molybdate transport repressor ModE-like protein
MNNLAGEPLVERLAGGKGGGGTRLTQRGRQLVENFRKIERSMPASCATWAARRTASPTIFYSYKEWP